MKAGTKSQTVCFFTQFGGEPIESEEIRHDLRGAGARRHFELMSTRLPWATATATPAIENEE